MPIFFIDDERIGSNVNNSLITNLLQDKGSNCLITKTTSSSLDVIATLQSQSASPFSLENVVYCIRYSEHPGYFRLGCVYDRTFIERLKAHASKTGLKPIVVFAFRQVTKFDEVHPEQFEIDLQQAVARDLMESGFFNTFNLKYVRQSGDYGFYYNGSESDITRICLTKSQSLFSDCFLPLSTDNILAGNKTLR